MKYSFDRMMMRELLIGADMANTITGGMSQPEINISRGADHYLVTARIPGVDTDSVKIEIVDKHVLIYHNIKFTHEEGPTEIPHIVASLPITIDVDYRKIEAEDKNNVLHITIPFSEIAGGYRRQAGINK